MVFIIIKLDNKSFEYVRSENKLDFTVILYHYYDQCYR